MWHCRCEACGSTTIARGDNLRSGKTKTCGCAGVGKGVAPKPDLIKLPVPKLPPAWRTKEEFLAAVARYELASRADK